MAMFDYKNYTSEKSIELMNTSSKLAIYANAVRFMYLPGDKLINTLSKLLPSFYPNPVNIGIPDGWRELQPAELKLPENSRDVLGYYTFISPVTGNRPISGMGPQAKILGEFNTEGVLTRIAVSWAGTNDPLDIADYFQLNEGTIAPEMATLLNAVKDYAQSNGLEGNDVIITGYSLGGGLTNIMAKYRETLADGFFNESDYIGHASPLIYDNPAVIFNFGYENDAVYRILGDAPTFFDAFAQLGPFLSNPDHHFESSVDNLVLFTNSYASPLWNILGNAAMSIINTPLGWAAHRGGVVSDAIKRISESPFYSYTERDTRIIIDHLTGFNRLTSWVKDKSGENRPVFIIGNDYGNKLESGKTGDYIDARGGNDLIYLGEGNDRVHGGSGTDTVILQGTQNKYTAYRLSDGTVFLQSNENHSIKQLESVEKISFTDELFTRIRPYDITEETIKSNRYLLKWRNKNLDYSKHTEGSDGDDVLQGSVVFGKDGDDVLIAQATPVRGGLKGSLLHGGEGDDILIGNRASDKLYGAEGNDYLYGGGGHDQLFGGIGNDIFAFDTQSKGISSIKDFNKYYGDHDVLMFSNDLFESKEAVIAAATQQHGHVSIYKDGVSIIIEDSSLAQLENHIVIL